MRFSYSDKNVGIFETIYTKFNSYISKQQVEYLKTQDLTKSVFDQVSSSSKSACISQEKLSGTEKTV